MLILSNPHLTAMFCSTTGLLQSLKSSDHSSEEIIQSVQVHYHDGKVLFPPPPNTSGASDKTGTWEVVSIKSDSNSIASILQSDLITVNLQATLKPDSPMLDMRVRVRGRVSSDLNHPPVQTYHGLLKIEMATDFINHFEDEEDLFFDGAQIAAGTILRPWRVFFRGDRRTGLFLATRDMDDMTRTLIGARSLGLCPHSPRNYEAVSPNLLPVDTSSDFEAGFQIGPWQAVNHDKILNAAALNHEVHIHAEPPTGQAPKNLQGEVVSLVQTAPPEAISRQYSKERWLVVDVPWSWQGQTLMANTNVYAPPIAVASQGRGPHRVFIGVCNGRGLSVKIQGEPFARTHFAPPWPGGGFETTPFTNILCGPQVAAEVDLGVIDLDGSPLMVGAFPGEQEISMLDYVRFVPLTGDESTAWRNQQKQKPCLELSGFSDTPDISVLTNPSDPDPDIYRANIWEQSRRGMSKIFWRIDGQCSDYPSKINTMRYPMAKVHGVFSPRAKAYGRVLRKVDMLRLAVDAAREFDVELWGWMRFNCYMGNVVSDFYRQNSQWWEASASGYRGRKLCMAIPEVRKHKIDILLEAARYGLAGLNLGFLRQAPVLHYHPVLVETFEKKYGQLPPRDTPSGDPDCLRHLAPESELHQRWFQHRADFMTLFGRELRASLIQANLGHLPISIWVRPNHCLYDGIDLPRWLNEGLCQEVVVNGMVGPDFKNERICGVDPQWIKMIQSKARIVRCAKLMFDYDLLKEKVPQIVSDGYDGFCTYESNWSVLDHRCVKTYDSLRRP